MFRKNLVIGWLLVSFWLLGPAAGAVEVVKSPNDDRQYQYLELPNHLKVLLVSDPKADKAAAALTVGVGSTANPPGREGLAHFLEHMLFMGTKKYPEVDEYSAFIKKNGGMDNAFTGGNQTTYYFDIKPEALEPALDRFAQFFIAPLMDARYVEREKHAVHSEYQLKLKDDNRRIAAAQRQGYNPRSPWSRFAVGNLETLADRPGHPVRQDLLEFYRKHYSANIMGLAVIGRQPLPVLRRWVEERFAAVPDRRARRLEPGPDELIYLRPQLPQQVSVVPLKKLHKLELSFPMPSEISKYRERPLFYLAHFIGDEGPGSLHAVLRKRGWLTSLTASASSLDRVQALFSVEMDLTEEGMKHIPEIIRAFFAYVELLREKGVESWRYDELARKKKLDFRFREKGAPSDYAVEISSRLLDYPPAEVLTAGTLLQRYDPELIRSMLDRLRPESMAVTLVDQNLQTDRVERWYQVHYSLGKPELPEEKQPRPWLAELALPRPNPFLPERVELKPVVAPTPIPRRLEESKGESLWFHQDDEFGVPRGTFVASLELPAANDSAEHAVALQLLLDLVNDRLNAYAYPAQVAGLGYSLTRTNKGLVLMVYGYDDKQPLLLTKVIEALARPRIPADRFQVLKHKLARELANKKLERPFRQVLEALDRALVKPSWSPEQQLAALRPLTLEKLESYASHLFDRAELKVLAHGNYTPKEAKAMERQLKEALLARSRLEPVPDPVVKRLPPGRQERLEYPVDHPDSVVVDYFQGADRSLPEKARWRLLVQVLRNDFYSALRTEQQLGYVVATAYWEKERLPGMIFLVQSSAAPAAEVEKRIRQFIDSVDALLSGMSEQDFAAFKAGLVADLRKKDRNLLERSLRYMDNLDRERYTFDYRRRLADAVEAVSREELLRFYHERLQQQPRELVAWSAGSRFKTKE